MTQGLILFAHGARDPRWAAPFQDMAQRVRGQRPQWQVRLAFLEFMTPDLSGAAAELVAAGCTQVDLLPVFLGSGGHVRKDLPRLLDGLRGQHAATTFRLHGAIGEVPQVLQAMADAAVAAAEQAVAE
ncbi:MAG: cobalamin [Pseudomonadota bacterium]|jgi:sirohydrochlorin cobaltochelatase